MISEALPAAALGSASPDRRTDLGNAQRLVREHGHDLRYVFAWRQWLVWDGRRWKIDDTGEIFRRAKQTVRKMFTEAVAEVNEMHRQLESSAGDGVMAPVLKARLSRANAAMKWAVDSHSARKLENMVVLARSEPGIPVTPDLFDKDPMLFNVANGTLDLRYAVLKPHSRDDYLTKLCPAEWDEDAACPLWMRSLGIWMDGNSNLCDYLQRMVGYSLTADVSEQVLFFMHGEGSNGKSTFVATILDLLGDYASMAVSDLLTMKHNDSHPTERADLCGLRFVGIIETEQGKRLAESLVKQLTGGDAVKARRMRQDFFLFKPTWKLFLAANHAPVIKGTDHAIWRRIRLIPFTVKIPDSEKLDNFSERLKAERSGILKWAVKGCMEWQKIRLSDPPEVMAATQAYQRAQDSLQDFFSECCTIADFARVKSSVLYDAYVKWSGEKGLSRPEFKSRMSRKGFDSRMSNGCMLYDGIGLNATTYDDDREDREAQTY